MKKRVVYMFIDALGWEIASKYGFLEKELPHRYRVKMQFGYSSAAIPTILSGEPPDKHGHFSFFYYDPENSPFKKFKYIKYFFGAGTSKNSLLNRGRVRRIISKIAAKAMGVSGYFSLYSVAFDKLPLFDYCEKSDIFARGGLAPVRNLRDACEESGLKFHISDWRKNERENIDAAMRAVGEGAEFSFIYTGAFDAFMHDFVFDESAIAERLKVYEKYAREIIGALKRQGADFEFRIISDHGMTPTKKTRDIMAAVESLGLEFGKDYVGFFDSTMARFWYPTRSEAAKAKIRAALKQFEGSLVGEQEKRLYGINFEGGKFGEDIFLTDPGVQIEPCDLGRKALKGMHGYSPEDKDSYACMLSTSEEKNEPKHVRDFFGLMASNLRK
ncbi:MAG: alkaline phosphatase family protein [Opitutales bacterium]|nr:alkaline phosphatase family protein [Opitutales bacterium]